MVSLAASPPWFPDLRRIARQFPEIVFVVNHLGGVGTHSAGLDEALSMVLDDHDVPNLLVKISGLHYGSPRPWDYPYLDRIRIVKRFYESWGPRRMVWASDFPMLLPFTSYRQSLELLREHASFIEASELPCILGGTLFAILSRLSKA